VAELPRAGGTLPCCALSASVEAVWREQRDGLHGLRLFARIHLSFTLSVDVINCADGTLCQQQSRKHQKMSRKRYRGRVHAPERSGTRRGGSRQRLAWLGCSRAALSVVLGRWMVPGRCFSHWMHDGCVTSSS